MQTDPNFANFLIGDDWGITLLDFGATIEYDEAFRARYVEILRASASGDRARIIHLGIDFELIDARESGEAREHFADMIVCSAEPFDAARQPFTFRDADYAARSRDIVARFVKSLEYSPPPRRIIFLHRKLGGLFQLLKRLDAQLDLAPYWAQMVHRPRSAPGPTHSRRRSPAGPIAGRLRFDQGTFARSTSGNVPV